MEYRSLYYFTTLYIVYLCCTQSNSELPVRLFLHQNPNVFQVYVKEFVIVGGDQVTIGCGTTIQQGITNMQITLRNGTNTLKSEYSGQLFWMGNPFSTSNLSCEITFSVNGAPSSSVTINDIVINVVEDPVTCFPETPDNVFLMDEIVQILCIARNGYSWEKQSTSLLFSKDQISMFPMMVRAIRNYVQLSTPGEQSIECTQERRESCTVENFSLKIDLNISISPAQFSNNSVEMIEFKCESNVPTDYISWYVEFDTEGILEVGPGSDLPWTYMVIHYTNSSVIVIPNGASGLSSVSCSTRRSGYLATATANNETSDIIEETDNSDNNTKSSTMTMTNTIISDISEENDISNNNAIGSSTAPFIITIVVLIIICIILATITGYVMYKRIRPEQKTTDVRTGVKMAVIQSSSVNDDPYYYATSLETDTNATDKSEGDKLPNSSTYMDVTEDHPRVSQLGTESANHLSTDILDYGAVVATNDAYQVT